MTPPILDDEGRVMSAGDHEDLAPDRHSCGSRKHKWTQKNHNLGYNKLTPSRLGQWQVCTICHFARLMNQ